MSCRFVKKNDTTRRNFKRTNHRDTWQFNYIILYLYIRFRGWHLDGFWNHDVFKCNRRC